MFGPSVSAAYAVQALSCMARPSSPSIRAETLAATTGVPRQYMAKLLHTLGRRGLLASQRGRHGGYRLARNPAKITLFDVIASIDGKETFQRCLLGLGRCSRERDCPLHRDWFDLRRVLERRFRELTLAELARDESQTVDRDYHFAHHDSRGET